jgi:hypothetical protein
MNIGDPALVSRFAIGLGCLLLFLGLSGPVGRIVDQEGLSRRLVAVIAASRICLFALVFLVLKMKPRGDVIGYYYPQALSVMKGMVPYRDFTSSYGFLHPYLDAAVLYIHNSSLTLIFLSIVLEMAALGVWYRLAGDLIQSEASLRRRLNQALLFYLCNSISIFTIAVDGTNNAILALGLGLSIAFLWRRSEFASGMSFSMSLLLAKVLPLIFLPLFIVTARSRWKWLAGCALPLILLGGVAAILHLNVLQPFQLEGGLGIESNLPYLLSAVTGVHIRPQIFQVFGGSVLLLAAAWYGWRLHLYRSVMGLSIASLGLLSLLLLLAPKAWPVYYEMLLFPFCWVVAGLGFSGRVWALILLAVAGVQASFWFTVLHSQPPWALHRQLAALQPQALLYLLLLSLLVCGYALLAFLCAHVIAKKSEPLL